MHAPTGPALASGEPIARPGDLDPGSDDVAEVLARAARRDEHRVTDPADPAPLLAVASEWMAASLALPSVRFVAAGGPPWRTLPDHGGQPAVVTEVDGGRLDEGERTVAARVGDGSAPATLVVVDGSCIGGAVVVGRRPDGLAASELRAVRQAARTLDREQVHRARAWDLSQRVRELTAHRRVGEALRRGGPWAEVVREVAGAVRDGLAYPGRARVEVTLDDLVLGEGRGGQLGNGSLVGPVTVDGVERGRFVVGYVDAGTRLLLPEEQTLVEGVASAVGTELARRDAQITLRRAEQRHRQLLEALPAVVWLVDERDMIELVSVGDAVPARRRDATERFALEAWDDPVAEELRSLAARARRGEQVTAELPWRERWWEIRVEPLRDDRGPTGLVLGLGVDVTERHRSHELEARLASLVRTTRVAVVGIDLDGTITSWNDGATHLFGYPVHEAVGSPIGLLDPVELATELAEERRRRGLGGVAEEPYVETSRRHRDGHGVEVGIAASAVRDAGGAIVGASLLYLDLTERNRAVRDAEASQVELRMLAEQTLDVVYRLTFEPDLRCDYVSPSASTVLGFAPEAFLEDPGLFRRRTHADDRHLLASTDDPSLVPTVVRIRFQHRDGSWRWIEDRRSPVVIGGRRVALSGVARDVTEEQRSIAATATALAREREAATRLREVDAMKSTFLTAVSHELRTPLTSVLGFAETARRFAADDVPGTELARLLERITHNAGRLGRLMDDLLDVDRLSRAELVPEPEAVRLDEVVHACVAAAAWEERTVVTDVDAVTVHVDPVMVDRAVDNLIRNAARHTPRDATVHVSLGIVHDRVRLVVEDDGPGVPAELRARVFEPFEQGPRAARAASPGTGIGLALVRRFVEANGGSVALDASATGGARFTVELRARP